MERAAGNGGYKGSRTDEDRLLLLMKTGDMEAFRRLYELTAKGIYSYALSILQQPQDAEEVMQDTYLTAWRQAVRYETEGKPMAWLLTIARNLCYMRLRRQKDHPCVSYEELEQEEPGELCSRIELVPEKQMLLDALTALGEDERKIVLLHDAGNMKHREIAQLLGIPLSTVLSKYRRALKRLQRLMDGEGAF
ncbi:MAG: RNA polymerase sigma factor [Hungatella sp.]|jgi:RNA polymerase sigma factor (sigma-70 family)|nr:RNA polymerase sigma factor [Hungatella sp.]